MPNIRMIWWDYGRVLFENHADDFVEKLAGLSVPRLSPAMTVRNLYASGLINQYDRGTLSTGSFIRAMQNLFGFTDAGIEQFVDAFQRLLRPNARAWGLVGNLAHYHYPQGVISNTNALHVRYIEDVLVPLGLPFISPRIYSYRLGVGKPDPEIYRSAFRLADTAYFWDKACRWNTPLKPEECVLIDDMSENVESFRALGGHAILHNSQYVHRTAAELLNLGVRL